MLNSHAYPRDLARYVINNWPSSGDASLPSQKPEVPDELLLENLLSICYQASLTRHEGEPVSFRVVLANPSELPDEVGPPDGLHKLEFAEPLDLNAAELRRLSPAARFSRSIIGISVQDDVPKIWGILNSGPRWLHASHGGRGSAPLFPPYLLVKVMGPGVMEVSCGNKTLVGLSEGRIFGSTLNVFKSKWLQEWFAPMRIERMEIYEKAKREADDGWPELEPDLTRVIDQHMLKRVIAVMRAFRHGGTLIFVSPSEAEHVLGPNPYLSMKYKFSDVGARARFRKLIIGVMKALAAISAESVEPVGWEDYQSTTDAVVTRLDEAIFELSHLISALSIADGAVVLTKRFELLGFGAEIHCDSSEVSLISRALDLEGTKFVQESVFSVGTRHRSAYRLCSQLKNALAIVVSQEGSVQFVKSNSAGIAVWVHEGTFDFAAPN